MSEARNNTQHNAGVACLVVVRDSVRVQRHSLVAIPPRRGREAANSRSSSGFTALADLRARHHTAAACLTEVPLDREAGFTLPRKKTDFCEAQALGVLAGNALAN